MVMLYHEHVKQYALHIDATGSLIRNLRRFKKILLYTATVQHPFAKSPPLPVAEYITTKQNQHSVKRFLGALVEMETLKYGKGNISKPKLRLLVFSMAIINATFSEFCGEPPDA